MAQPRKSGRSPRSMRPAAKPKGTGVKRRRVGPSASQQPELPRRGGKRNAVFQRGSASDELPSLQPAFRGLR